MQLGSMVVLGDDRAIKLFLTLKHRASKRHGQLYGFEQPASSKTNLVASLELLDRKLKAHNSAVRTHEMSVGPPSPFPRQASTTEEDETLADAIAELKSSDTHAETVNPINSKEKDHDRYAD